MLRGVKNLSGWNCKDGKITKARDHWICAYATPSPCGNTDLYYHMRKRKCSH